MASTAQIHFVSCHIVQAIFLLLFCSQLSCCQVLECYNDEMYSNERHIFLDFHNDVRRRVAHGLEPNGAGGTLPPASNMYELKWSCLLEDEMQKQLSNCPTSFPQITGFGRNLMTIDEHSGAYVLPHREVRNTLRDWWSELDIYGISESVVKFTNEVLHNFANMVFANNTEIGCSFAYCEKDHRLLIGCLYRKNGAVMDQLLYSSGRACKYNIDCETYKNSKCLKNGLCNKGRFYAW